LFKLTDNNIGDVEVKVDNYPVSFLIDSGASINLIDKTTFDKLLENCDVKLDTTSAKVYSYGSKVPLPLKGVFYSNISLGNKHDIARILVSSSENTGCIMSRDTAIKLGLLNIQFLNTLTDPNTNNVAAKFPKVFSGLGKLRNVQLKLSIDENINPVSQHLRRIPFHVRKQVSLKLQELLELDIIEPVSGPTPWVSPVIAIPKPDKNDIRLVVDMRKANLAIKRNHYPIPTLDELLEEFNGCSIFSKIDLRHGYHQIELHPESRPITTFITHNGLYRYKRLVQGATSAFEEYQNKIGQLFQNVKRVKNIADDILIGGKDQTEHDINLNTCLQILQENNLTAKLEKCEFSVPKLNFFGHCISHRGIKPTEDKVKAVQEFEEPTSSKEVSSFLGMITYLAKFIPNLSTETETLRQLLHKDQPWVWGAKQSESFNRLKSLISSDNVVAHFDPNLKTVLIVDAGPIGLGAILAQEHTRDIIRPVAFASRTLTAQERRYSQTEREALGVVWGCERFHLYLYGKTFEILTDHQPLKVLYNHTGKPSPRILRWGLRLQSYSFTIKHIPGKLNPADILSIIPSSSPLL
jgi:hypothetical protein